jgi:CubicO group peptidase (beta-lactamase class C family)
MSFSHARLGRMHDVLAGHVAREWVPGLVSLVSQGDQQHVEVIGEREVGGAPMRRDSIFRVASLTKPITAAATMLLVEECVLRLDDPVDEHLPELADRQVLVKIDGPLDETVPANRPITVRDLLTFRLGFGFVPGGSDLPIVQAATEKQVAVSAPGGLNVDTDEWIANLGSLPLMVQPGDRWLYHTGSDVLGVLIPRVTGRPLDMFLRERLFDPLGMTDTGFFVPDEKKSRLTASYRGAENGELVLGDGIEDTAWNPSLTFLSAGGGLVSTVDDLHAFGRMLLHKGKHEGARILSRAAVELMTTDHLTPDQKALSGFMPGYFDTRGWGFGVAVDTVRVDLHSVGRFGWDGGTGTSLWMDPAEDLVGVLLTQRAVFPLASPLYLDFWTSLYQAIDD